jgi:hypothetical protein
MSGAMRCLRDRGGLNWLGPGFLFGDDADPLAAAAGHCLPRWQIYLSAIRQLDEPPDEWSITLDDVLGALRQTPRQAGRFTHLVSSASDQSIAGYQTILFVRIVA